MTDEEIKKLAKEISESLKGQIDPTVIAGKVPEAVKAYLDRQSERNEDPFRTTIHFLGGLMATSVALTVGIFAAFPKSGDAVATHMMGGMLAWIAVAAILTAICIGIVQFWKWRYRLRLISLAESEKPKRPCWIGIAAIMSLPGLFSLVAASYAIRGGAAMIEGSTELPGFQCAFSILF